MRDPVDSPFYCYLFSGADQGSLTRERRYEPYISGIISFTPTLAQFLDETAQDQEILEAEQRSSSGQGHERIGSLNIRPARRNRVDTLVTRLAKEHPVLPPGVGEADQLVFLTVQGMEGMRDTESLPITAVLSS